MKLREKQKGIVLIVMSALCFACMNVFVRLSGDLPTAQKSFFRNIVACLVAGVILLREKKGFLPASPGNWPLLLVRATAGTVGLLANFYAVDHLVLSDASMLGKMAPFFAVIASRFVLKEKLHPVQMLSLGGAFLGALCIIKPSVSNLNLVPALIGLLGGLGAGIAYTFVRVLGQRGERRAYIVFVFSAFSCLAVMPYVVTHYVPMTPSQLACLLGAGVCATGGQFFVTSAYCCAPAREISVYDYTQVIFAAVLGLVVFADVPDAWSFVGYAVICGMGLLTYWYHNVYLNRAGGRER